MKRTKCWFAGLLSAVLIFTLLPVASLAANAEWAQSAVTTLNGIYGNGVFSADDTPMTKGDAYTVLHSMGCASEKVQQGSDDNLTRSEACEVLAEVFDLPVEGNSSAIQYLYEKNIINGKAGGDLDETGKISKAEFAVLTYRVLNAVGGGMGSSNTALKPGTEDYFAWMYLAARTCVPFQSSQLDTAIKNAKIKFDGNTVTDATEDTTNVVDASETVTGIKSGEEIWNAWKSKLNISGNSPAYSGEQTLIEAAKTLVKSTNAKQIFSDVAPSDYFFDGVMYLFDQQIVQGTGDGTFAPEGGLRRFELAVLLARVGNAPIAGENPIIGSISHAINQGYMTGTAPTTWENNADWTAPVAREEAIIALMKQQDVSVTNVNTNILSRFTGSSVSSTLPDADKYIAYAVSIGLVKGTSGGGLDLSGSTTRGMLGVLLYRTLLGVDETKMKDYEENVTYAKGGASPAMFLALSNEVAEPTPQADTERTLTLREDWRLTSDLDLAVGEGETLTINGNGHHIYEMGGKLKNSGTGTVTFTDGTILYPAANDADAKNITTTGTWDTNESNELMVIRQPHEDIPAIVLTITPSTASISGGGTVALTTSKTADSVTCSDTSITVTGSGTSWTATLPNRTATYTFTATAEGETATCQVSVSQYSSSGSDDSDDSNYSGSGNTTTQTTTNPDGSKTTTVTDKKTGTVTETTRNKDGSTLVVETKKDGTVTETTTAKDGSSLAVETRKDGTVTTTETRTDNVKIKTVDAPGENVTATVTIPKSAGTSTVAVPANVTPGTVAVDARTGEIVKLSVPTEDGIIVKLDGSAELVLEDRSKDFDDTENHWAGDGIDFAVAHGMFSGTGETTFAPDNSMTRAMLMTLLARFDGQDTNGGATWYEKGMEWAKAAGVSDGTNPNGAVTREQLAAMLYRYAGSPPVDGSIDHFADADKVSGYAADAIRWAVNNGIISGMDDGTLAPQVNATRAQVATMLMRFCTNLTR